MNAGNLFEMVCCLIMEESQTLGNL